MKILLLSFHFPPEAPMAATRAPKFAKYLLERGADVRVLCASNPDEIGTHPLEIAEARVLRTPWVDPRKALVPNFVKRKSPAGAAPAASSAQAAPPREPLRAFARAQFNAKFCRPDPRIGWRPHALNWGAKATADWMPDVIYATCPPHSTAVIAEALSQKLGVPFVAEFRDRWALDAYSDHPEWRQKLDRRDEARVLSQAAEIVTVSPLWAQSYADRYGAARVTTSMNGFDPDDYPLTPPIAPNEDRDTLTLLYAGSIYPGRRDPAPLFHALPLLGEAQDRVRVQVVGSSLSGVREAAQAAGVGGQVSVLPPASHSEIKRMQYRADALVMLQWNDERDAGTVPGKLFECIGARRPIIATGWPKGVVADIIRRRDLGLLSNDPAVIAKHLGWLLNQKRAHGRIKPLPARIRDGFSRAEQFDAIVPVLERITGATLLERAAEALPIAAE